MLIHVEIRERTVHMHKVHAALPKQSLNPGLGFGSAFSGLAVPDPRLSYIIYHYFVDPTPDRSWSIGCRFAGLPPEIFVGVCIILHHRLVGKLELSLPATKGKVILSGHGDCDSLSNSGDFVYFDYSSVLAEH
jgi:hypothetical protein